MGVEFTGLQVRAVGFTDAGIDVGGTFFCHAPDAITRVDEQEKDEKERYFQTVLDFSDLRLELHIAEEVYDRRGGDELEEATTPSKGEREDEETEDRHFKHEKGKDLNIRMVE